jgi:hypothetical protein
MALLEVWQFVGFEKSSPFNVGENKKDQQKRSKKGFIS